MAVNELTLGSLSGYGSSSTLETLTRLIGYFLRNAVGLYSSSSSMITSSSLDLMTSDGDFGSSPSFSPVIPSIICLSADSSTSVVDTLTKLCLLFETFGTNNSSILIRL
ncbi:hypothetical protein OGATHE_003987 [Ogataea polymorpha]|uniref:Uncharacterized protein n=1 Tax=Ogataea polymorpha TaxID=460523 RepID=A0A9P8P573_9ASCO|nr:hypothetical protein OGATHE_003987 [Ogataea polymorpha]